MSDTLDAKINRALAHWNTHGGFGQNWSVSSAAFNLIRLGEKADLGVTKSLIWDLPGVNGETLLTTTDGNLIDTVSSSNAGDTTQEYIVYGSYFNGDGDLVRRPQAITLNGQTKVTLPFPVARVCEVVATDGTVTAGNVYVYQDSAITAGVPDDLTLVANYVAGTSSGPARSQKCGCVTAGDESLIIIGGLFAVNKKQSAYAEFTLEFRQNDHLLWTKAMGSVTLATIGLSAMNVVPPVLGIMPPNYDVRVVATASAADVPVSGTLMGVYAKQK